LFAEHILITAGPGKEDKSEFARLLAGLQEHFHSQGMLESLLIETIAASLWRRRRVLRFETTQTQKRLEHGLPATREMDLILRSAASLDRELYRALNQLERVQRQRLGESPPQRQRVPLEGTFAGTKPTSYETTTT
jgi:hypothetical protein